MAVRLLLAMLGLAVLTVAADRLVLGAGRVARRLRMSPAVVGVVVIGLGTSAPEFLVSGLAAARGDSGLAVGNLVGSDVVNLTLVLGIAALLGPVVVRSSVVRREAPLAVVLFAVAVWQGLGPALGAVLGVTGLGVLISWCAWPGTTPAKPCRPRSWSSWRTSRFTGSGGKRRGPLPVSRALSPAPNCWW